MQSLSICYRERRSEIGGQDERLKRKKRKKGKEERDE